VPSRCPAGIDQLAACALGERFHADRGEHLARHPQCRALRLRQAVRVAQHRGAELMQPRERQLHLRLQSRRARYPATTRLPGQVVQQHGLAHARVAAHHQRTAMPGLDRLDQPVQRIPFAAPVRQSHRAAPPESAVIGPVAASPAGVAPWP
jgi:hypothetical protein